MKVGVVDVDGTHIESFKRATQLGLYINGFELLALSKYSYCSYALLRPLVTYFN